MKVKIKTEKHKSFSCKSEHDSATFKSPAASNPSWTDTPIKVEPNDKDAMKIDLGCQDSTNKESGSEESEHLLNPSTRRLLQPSKVIKTDVFKSKLKRPLNQDLRPGEHASTRNYCHECDKEFSSKQHHHIHVKLYHSGIPKPNPRILPDEHDPDYFCRSCIWVFRTKYQYHQHLRSTHFMRSMPMPNRRPKVQHQVLPDVNDPENYCKSCEKTCSDRQAYVNHLLDVHKTTTTENSLQKDLSDADDSNHYCKICKRKYSRSTYRRHLKSSHKITLIAQAAQPDRGDLVIRCESCNQDIVKLSYLKYMERMHNTTLTPEVIRQLYNA